MANENGDLSAKQIRERIKRIQSKLCVLHTGLDEKIAWEIVISKGDNLFADQIVRVTTIRLIREFIRQALQLRKITDNETLFGREVAKFYPLWQKYNDFHSAEAGESVAIQSDREVSESCAIETDLNFSDTSSDVGGCGLDLDFDTGDVSGGDFDTGDCDFDFGD